MPDTTSNRSNIDNISLATPGEQIQDQPRISLHMMERELPLSLQREAAMSVAAETSILPGTVEHLLARQPVPPLDEDTQEVAQRLSLLRSEMTHLLTRRRWRRITIQEGANQVISHIQVGPFRQWQRLLLFTLYEIDRAGNLLPIWCHLIERGDPSHLSSQTDPTTDPQAYARRVAILLLGYYKQPLQIQQHLVGFASQSQHQPPDLAHYLGTLLLDPATSLYAAQALATMGTQRALEELLRKLPEAQGWPRVDILERCLALQQKTLYAPLLACGLKQLHGLEIYAARSFYRALALEKYLRQPLLATQAALIFHRMLLDSEALPQAGQPLPLLFERPLPDYASSLFQGAKQHPTWQAALTLHALGILLGRYWQAISQNTLLEDTITAQIYPCLPMMPEIEQWMHETGHMLLESALHIQDMSMHSFIQQALRERREQGVNDATISPR